MAFGKRGTAPEAPVAVEEADVFDLLNLSRINLHPSLTPLFTRREGLHQRKADLLQGKQQLEAVRTDFEKLHSLALAEGVDATILHQWKELKQQLADYDDQLTLLEAGQVEIDQLLDEQMGATREEIQAEIDRLFLPEVEAMITALQAVVETNNRLHQIENCSARLLSTGKLYCFNEGLDGWIYALTRKRNLLSPE